MAVPGRVAVAGQGSASRVVAGLVTVVWDLHVSSVT